MLDGEGLRRLKVFIEESGGFELAARRLDVRPSTFRKVLAGRHISLPTKSKLNAILGEQITEKRQPVRGFDSVTSTIRGTIKSQVDIFEASSKFDVNPSTIRKILEGKPVSSSVQAKLIAAIQNPLPDSADSTSLNRSSMVETLKHIHKLYEDLGTLEAAGRVIGVTRERVRQLLVKGSHLGLFEYKPLRSICCQRNPNCRLPKTFEFGAFGQGEWDYLWISWQVAKWNTLQFRLTFCSYRKREISDGQCSSRHLRVANQSGRLFHDP